MTSFLDFKTFRGELDTMDEITTILFVTSNQGKLSEVKLALSQFGLNVEEFRLYDHDQVIEEIQASSLHHVARDKLRKAVSLVSKSSKTLGVMVEDAGFFINEFDGFPGVYSSYVHQTLGIKGILRTLDGIMNRNASFKCTIGLYFAGEEVFFEGECQGHVSKTPIGSNGFGYDPIFIPNEGDGRTFAEMNSEEKQIFSHRGKAIDQLRAYLEERNQSPTSNHGSES